MLHQTLLFFGGGLSLLLGLAHFVRPHASARNQYMGVLSISVSAVFGYIYALHTRVEFTPAIINHLYLPFIYVLGPGMYLAFESVLERPIASPIRNFILASTPLTLLLLLIVQFVSPSSLSYTAHDYFYENKSLHWIDTLPIIGFFQNIVYYVAAFIRAAPIFHPSLLRKEDASRALFIMLLGSGIVTGFAATAYITKDLGLIVVSMELTVILAVVSYLAAERAPDLFRNLVPNARRVYRQSRLVGLDLEQLGSRLRAIMQEEKLYLTEDLTLSTVAEKIQIRPDQLSQYLNEYLEMNFSRFINGYRVEEAARMLEVERKASVLSVAFRCGFNSKANFNLAFKAIMGVSPREFLRQKTKTETRRIRIPRLRIT